MTVNRKTANSRSRITRVISMETKFRIAICCVVILIFIPSSHASASQVANEASAAETAVLLSQFEYWGEVGSLYGYLHLDAKVLIPAGAISGWYDEMFFPSGPGVITVTNVAIVPWTWGVTGITYPETAEVSFKQPFANGVVVEDVVRLVKENGAWYWFFGRSLDFVNQQISQYTPQYPLIDDSAASDSQVLDGIAPWGIDAMATSTVDESALSNAVPGFVVDHVLGRITSIDGSAVPTFAIDGLLATYHKPPEQFIPSGEVHIFNLTPGHTVAEALSVFDSDSDGSSNFTVLREARTSQTGVMFVFVDLYANDAVGDVPILYWGRSDGTQLFSASMLDYVSLRLLVIELMKAMS